MSKSSYVAMFAAAGLFVGGMASPSAHAADLGGDCCADLEERVAELEATTARKGNRRMSLTITGHVNRSVLFWDDGHSSGSYVGLDNTSSSSRFSLLGEARIQPRLKAGFELMLEMEFGSATGAASQFNEDGASGTHFAPVGGAALNANAVDPIFGGIRRAAWWIEHQDMGRLTVGRWDVAGVVTTIDLGGIGVIAGATKSTANGGFFFRTTGGALSTIRITDVTEGASAGTVASRTDMVRYDSPSLGGFIVSGMVAEAGDYWGVMARYAGEFSGFRIAAGIGYESIADKPTVGVATSGQDMVNSMNATRNDLTAVGGAVSLMHVPTGLFVQGHYYTIDMGNADKTVASGYWNQRGNAGPDASDWTIQAGITKNWLGFGNTSLYGEYGVQTGFGAENAGRTFAAPTGFVNNGLGNVTNVAGVTDTEVTTWGIGLVQNIDAAATELYIGYRNFALESNYTAATAPAARFEFDNIHAIQAGARVKF